MFGSPATLTCTTFTTQHREKGKVATIRRMENKMRKKEQIPGHSLQPSNNNNNNNNKVKRMT